MLEGGVLACSWSIGQSGDRVATRPPVDTSKQTDHSATARRVSACEPAEAARQESGLSHFRAFSTNRTGKARPVLERRQKMSIAERRRPRPGKTKSKIKSRSNKSKKSRGGSWPLSRILGASGAPRPSSERGSLVGRLALMLKRSTSPGAQPAPQQAGNRSGWACRLVGALTGRAGSAGAHAASAVASSSGEWLPEPESCAPQQQCCSASLASGTWPALNGLETASSTSGCFVSSAGSSQAGSHCSLAGCRGADSAATCEPATSLSARRVSVNNHTPAANNSSATSHQREPNTNQHLQIQHSRSSGATRMAGGLLSAAGAGGSTRTGSGAAAASLLSRARNSTLNLAQLAGRGRTSFHVSASAGHLCEEAPRRSASSSAVKDKDKRRRQKELERVHKLKLLVSYLKSGSHQALIQPVRLEADELELAQRFKQSQIMCDLCLAALEAAGSGSSGARTPNPCPQPGCSNHAASQPQQPAPSSPQSTGSRAQRLFYIDELEPRLERKASDSSDSTQTSRLTQQVVDTPACLGCRAHLRSMVAISTVGSEPGEPTGRLPARSFSTELFLSSTPAPRPLTLAPTPHLRLEPAVRPPLDLTAASSSSNTSGVGHSSGSLPTVASAHSFNQHQLQHLAPQPTGSGRNHQHLFLAAEQECDLCSCCSNCGCGSSSANSITSSGHHRPHHQQPQAAVSTDGQQPHVQTIANQTDGSTASQTSAWAHPQTLATWIDQEVNSLVHDLEAKSSLIDTKTSAKSSKRLQKRPNNKHSQQ